MKTFINSDRFEKMKKATLFLSLFCFVTTGYSQVTLSDKQQDKKVFQSLLLLLKQWFVMIKQMRKWSEERQGCWWKM